MTVGAKRLAGESWDDGSSETSGNLHTLSHLSVTSSAPSSSMLDVQKQASSTDESVKLTKAQLEHYSTQRTLLRTVQVRSVVDLFKTLYGFNF